VSPSVTRFRRGRRLTDPAGVSADPGTRAVRGRLAAVSVRASVGAGAWVGFALGAVVGVLAGAFAVWFAGSILDWQRDLAFTFGVARRLLPFGDQVGLLRDMQARWWLVIPAFGLGFGALGAVVGALLGGILAAAYNRSPRHALVAVELPALVAPTGAREASTVDLGAPDAPESTTVDVPAPVPSSTTRRPRSRPGSPSAFPFRTPRPATDPVLHSRLHGGDREE
jgi:hypothetical protein